MSCYQDKAPQSVVCCAGVQRQLQHAEWAVVRAGLLLVLEPAGSEGSQCQCLMENLWQRVAVYEEAFLMCIPCFISTAGS